MSVFFKLRAPLSIARSMQVARGLHCDDVVMRIIRYVDRYAL